MQQNRPVRVIKREQRVCADSSATTTTPETIANPESAETSERKLRTVVSGWVREHQQRTEEYRQMFATLLKEVGFSPAQRTSRA